MNSKFSMLKGIVLTTVLVAGVSGMAHAGDNSMSRFGGDSYAYFNSAIVDKAPSGWRQANPNGVSELQLELASSEALARDFQRPTFDKAPSTFRQTYPNGLSDREFQALSSEASAWHQPNQPAANVFASTNGAFVVAKTAAK